MFRCSFLTSTPSHGHYLPFPFAEYWRSHLTEEEIAQATLLFKQVDADQSNTIQANEFRTLILSIDETMTEERIQEVMKSVDSNGDGVISMEEWLNAFAKDLHF